MVGFEMPHERESRRHHGDEDDSELSLQLSLVDAVSDHAALLTELDGHYRYWSFMEGHPAHAQMSPAAHAEASDALTWSYTGQCTLHQTVTLSANHSS